MSLRRPKSALLGKVLVMTLLLSMASIEAAGAREMTATKVLDQLVVKGRAPKTGYDRTSFGRPWSDVDRNGCDTRNDILLRDLKFLTFENQMDKCVIVSGVLEDPYSGELIDYIRGRTSSLQVQIDHVVSLSNAWQTGAFAWEHNKRREFANDPLNLKAVKGSLNAQKGDGDAATWLPPNKAYRCSYVARQIAVKYRYRLWITSAERESFLRVLKRCPRQDLPES